jgi:hypothetical protein
MAKYKLPKIYFKDGRWQVIPTTGFSLGYSEEYMKARLWCIIRNGGKRV